MCYSFLKVSTYNKNLHVHTFIQTAYNDTKETVKLIKYIKGKTA